MGDPNDKRMLVLLSIALQVHGREDVVIDIEGPGALERLLQNPFKIKEGSRYNLKLSFRVQHNVLEGLKYLERVKRKNFQSDKSEEVLGSLAPNTEREPIYEKKLVEEEAPSGMLYRGHYEVLSRFMDNDGHNHLEFNWSFDITKDW